MDFDPNELPKDEWICDVCKAVNTNWRYCILYLLKKQEPKFMHGFCPNCSKILQDKEDRKKALILEKEKKERMESLYSRSEIPANIKTASFDKLVVRVGAENAFERMKKLPLNRNWVYLYGDNSVGKSYLMGATINYLIKDYVPVLYVNESQLFDRIRFSWNNSSGESEYDVFKLFIDADVVFWDEFLLFNFLDRETPNWKYERMYSLIEYCSENGKVIVFSSNIDPSDIDNVEYSNVRDRAGKRKSYILLGL